MAEVGIDVRLETEKMVKQDLPKVKESLDDLRKWWAGETGAAAKRVSALEAAPVPIGGAGAAAGGAEMAWLGPLAVAVFAAVAALVAFRRALDEVPPAMERARNMYAKQLTSGGLPGGFVAQQSALAGVLGVGEDNVWQYAQAVEYLNQRLAWSSKQIAATTPALAAAAWEFKVLEKNVQAAWMRMAHDLAPVLISVARGASIVVEALSNLREVMIRFIPMAQLLRLLPGGEAPMPTVSAKRFQPSAWERMGLVIGGGMGGIQYARDTEKNTRRTANAMERLLANVGRGAAIVMSHLPLPNRP